MMWGYDGGAGWWWGFGVLHMVLYWAVLFLAVGLLIKWLFGRSGSGGERRGQPPVRSALDILKERYARGEIGKDEYDQKKRDLQD